MSSADKYKDFAFEWPRGDGRNLTCTFSNITDIHGSLIRFVAKKSFSDPLSSAVFNLSTVDPTQISIDTNLVATVYCKGNASTTLVKDTILYCDVELTPPGKEPTTTRGTITITEDVAN